MIETYKYIRQATLTSTNQNEVPRFTEIFCFEAVKIYAIGEVSAAEMHFVPSTRLRFIYQRGHLPAQKIEHIKAHMLRPVDVI